jgi:hypothetical protein
MQQGEVVIFAVPSGRKAASFMSQLGGEARRVGIIPAMELLLAVGVTTKTVHELIQLTAKEKNEY